MPHQEAPGSRHLVDPALRPLLDVFPDFHFSHETLPDIRAQFLAAFATEVPNAGGGDDVACEERWIPGPAGGNALRIVLYRPHTPQPGSAALLHVHGGGYVIGAPEMDAPRNRALARELGCTVVSVDYRLPPEHPHPAPLDDCYAALSWLHAQCATLQLDPARIGVYGESAGGGLAAALCLLARDKGEVPVRFQLLIYPMLDDRTVVSKEQNPLTGEFVWSREANAFGWACLLGQAPGSEAVSPYAAPARAADLAGLPPTFIGVGALDLFLEENLLYAQRLLAAGVATELHVYPAAYHGFEMFAKEATVSRRFERDIHEALAAGLR